MKYFFDVCDALREDIAGKKLFLFLDYDGTLTPIVDRPEKAALPAVTKKLLEELTENPLCKVVIVTGRAVSDVRKLVGLENISYIGNHGFEIDALGLTFEGFNFSRTREVMDYLKWRINQELLFFKGAFIEDKGICLCVHYFQLNENQEEVFKTLLNNITIPFFLKNEIRIELDKKVFEIKPPIDWDKGKAVLWFLDQYKDLDVGNAVPVYIGDSLTDEDAFRVLKNNGITVRVGKSERSLADCYIYRQSEVTALLREIVSGRETETD
jgi:trehalose-phosphatase